MVSPGPSFPRFAWRVAAMLALLIPLAGARGQGSEIAGTMPEDSLPGLRAILATALQRSPQLIEAEFRRSVQEAQVIIAQAPRLPGVGGQLNYARNETAISSANSSQSTADGFFYNLSVSQALFHWGALKNASDAARLRLAIEQRKFDLAYRTLAGVLRKAYLALIVEKTRVRHARDALAFLRADLVVLATRRETGAISAAALAGEQLREKEVALETERAEADFAANRARFARLAGLGEFSEDAVPAEIPAPTCTPALASALTAALLRDGAKSTIEYEIHDLAVREAIERHKVEKVRLLPKFYLGAGVSLENSTDVNNNTVNQQGIQRRSVNLSATWNIFDGFATKGATREALAARRLAERTLAARTEEMLQDAQNLARSLALDVRQAELGDIRRGLAVEGRRRAAEEAALGNVPQGDADRAALGIVQAEAAQYAARAVLLGRWSDLVALAGDDPVLNPSRHAREKK
jgi:outer membrane protein TolC